MNHLAIRSTSVAVRLLAESFARERGYSSSLLTMCSTVSAGLVIALRAKGCEASMVAGYFNDSVWPKWGHFWAEAMFVTDRGKVSPMIVDLTATQFANARIRPRSVVIARYRVGYGKRYRVTETNAMRAREMVQPCDVEDVAEFERRCRAVRWIRAESSG